MTNDVAAKRQYRSPSQIARDRAADDQRRREKAEERERRKAKDKAEKEERDAARAKRKDETAIKAAEVEALKLQRQREKAEQRAAVIDKKAEKQKAKDVEEAAVAAVTKYFHDGGEMRLFADIPENGERRFGGVKLFPPRKSVVERPPAGCSYVDTCAGAVVVAENYTLEIIRRAFRCAGLYRASGTLRREKDKLTVDEIGRIESNARHIGFLPTDAPMDDVVLFNDVETMRQLHYLVVSKGVREAVYSVGTADNEYKLFDGRLIPQKSSGIGTMNRPFRNFILAESGGVWRRDIDFKACYPHILRQFARHIGEPCPVLDDYLANYAAWKRDYPGCKLKTLIAMFRPDKLPPESDYSKPACLQREMGSVIMKLVKPQEGITPDGSSSPLGSAAARLFQRVERALIDEACAAFAKAGFGISAYIYDGFVISASSELIAKKCGGDAAACEEFANSVCDTLNRLWVEDELRGVYSHKIEIKKFEYPNTPQLLDEAPTDHFDYEHPTFGRISAIKIASGLSGIIFPSFADLLTEVGAYVSRMCVTTGGNMFVLKNTGTFIRKTGEHMVRVDEKTGRTIRPPEMLATTVSYCRAKDAPELGKYISSGNVARATFDCLVNIAGFGVEHFTSMLPIGHPLMTPLHFTSRMRPVGVQSEWYKLITVDEARELLEGDGEIGILPHIRNILTAEYGDVGFVFFLEILCRSLLSSRSDVCVILTGKDGGEVKSGFMNWFGEFVLGIASYLVQTGIGDCANRFRSEIDGKSLILYEEMQVSHSDSANESVFKRSVDSKTVQIEIKGVDRKRIEPNIATFVGCSNHAEPIALTAGIDRRVVIMTVSSKYTSSPNPNAGVEYAAKLFEHFNDPRMGAAFAKYLLEYFVVQHPFDQTRPMNPNVLSITATRAAALFSGLTPVERVFYHAAVSKAICLAWIKSTRNKGVEFVMPTDARNLRLSVSEITNTAVNCLGFDPKHMSAQKVSKFLTQKGIGTQEHQFRLKSGGKKKIHWIEFDERGCPSGRGKGEFLQNPFFKPAHWATVVEEITLTESGKYGFDSLADKLGIRNANVSMAPSVEEEVGDMF